MSPRRHFASFPFVVLLALSACTPPARDHRYFGSITPPQGQVFRFNNGAEPEGTDPGVISGQPDGRVARMLFEGLVTADPQTLEPRPGLAYRWESSADGLVYTYHLRPGLLWSDGTSLTSRDFLYSWTRALDPITVSRNASLLYPVRNGERFNKGELTDAAQLGLAAPDDSTFVVTLENPTAYWLFLNSYYTFLPVPRHTIEKWGVRWTRPEHIVNNGPFNLAYWKQYDRFEFIPNEKYWDRSAVKLERIIAYTVDDLNTSTNLYKAGVIDWNPSGYIPGPFIPQMQPFEDFRKGSYQGVYFYSVNVTRKPYDNAHVRRALNLAIDRLAITRDVLKGSREPWGRITPSGYPGYEGAVQVAYDPARAREELAKAGYPGGKGFPKLNILFNTSEDHRRIAETIQAMWKRDLGIQVELSNQDWGSYLQATTSLQYDVARRSWIGDYLDPNSFLQLLTTGDGNNRSGWSDPEYDALIKLAARTLDPAERFRVLQRAETMAVEAAPFLPIYHYSTIELVKPWVRGLYPTALDTHPLKAVFLDHEWQQHQPRAGGNQP
ncbi:MAG: peptide ABC transporter substrate-binding protein [Candidatus Eisenbacteria bacterium]